MYNAFRIMFNPDIRLFRIRGYADMKDGDHQLCILGPITVIVTRKDLNLPIVGYDVSFTWRSTCGLES